MDWHQILYSRSPLVLAVSLGMCQVVTALPAKGADKNVADKEGRTCKSPFPPEHFLLLLLVFNMKVFLKTLVGNAA